MRSFFVTFVLTLSSLVTAQTYTNPLNIDAADPHVIFYNGTYYLYPTGDNVSYHVYTSKDLITWKKGNRVYAPAGANNVWAPCVYHHPDDGKFYLYYSVNRTLGVAVADQPDGTFENVAVLRSGAIDAYLFRDDDSKLYLYYALNAREIWVQPMKDPVTRDGTPKFLTNYRTEFAWENPRNEGPAVIRRGGTYYLIYSGNDANTSAYAVGYATASSPTGPFTKYAGNPILKASGNVYGPGHGMLINDAEGNWWHVYHQKNSSKDDWSRSIAIDPVWFDAQCVMHTRGTRGTEESAPVAGTPKYEFVEPLESPCSDGATNTRHTSSQIKHPGRSSLAADKRTHRYTISGARVPLNSLSGGSASPVVRQKRASVKMP